MQQRRTFPCTYKCIQHSILLRRWCMPPRPTPLSICSRAYIAAARHTFNYTHMWKDTHLYREKIVRPTHANRIGFNSIVIVLRKLCCVCSYNTPLYRTKYSSAIVIYRIYMHLRRRAYALADGWVGGWSDRSGCRRQQCVVQAAAVYTKKFMLKIYND